MVNRSQAQPLFASLIAQAWKSEGIAGWERVRSNLTHPDTERRRSLLSLTHLLCHCNCPGAGGNSQLGGLHGNSDMWHRRTPSQHGDPPAARSLLRMSTGAEHHSLEANRKAGWLPLAAPGPTMEGRTSLIHLWREVSYCGSKSY